MDTTTQKQASTRKRWMVATAIILFVLIVDQIIKYLVKTNMQLHDHIDITSWFQILFTENKGMAYGMAFSGTWLLTIFRLITIIPLFWILTRIIKKHLPMGLVVCLSMIIAGAIGNIIDNCLYGLIFTESYPEYLGMPIAHVVPLGHGYGHFLDGKVVDMFYFPLFTWPQWVPILGGKVFFNAIFNFADSSISCGAIALLLFYSRFFHIKQKEE